MFVYYPPPRLQVLIKKLHFYGEVVVVKRIGIAISLKIAIREYLFNKLLLNVKQGIKYPLLLVKHDTLLLPVTWQLS